MKLQIWMMRLLSVKKRVNTAPVVVKRRGPELRNELLTHVAVALLTVPKSLISQIL